MSSRQTLIGELEAQLRARGVAPARARAIAENEVHAQTVSPEDDPPWLVVPHTNGWCVTRAFAVNPTETFVRRTDAERRARELAEPKGVVVVYDSAGSTPRKL